MIEELKRILFLKNSEEVGLGNYYTNVNNLIKYTFSYKDLQQSSFCPIAPTITYYNVNINDSFNGDRIWNFVFSGTTQNGVFTAVFQFEPSCYVPNGVDKYQLKDINFYKPNSTEYEPFQGYAVVNGNTIGISGGPVGPVGTPPNTNNNIVVPTWDVSTGTFTITVNLSKTYVGWYQQIQPLPRLHQEVKV